MSKLSYEDKIKIYQERKQGNTIKNISKKYGVRIDGIKYLVRLIDKHGFDILRTNKNRKFTSYEKEQITTQPVETKTVVTTTTTQSSAPVEIISAPTQTETKTETISYTIDSTPAQPTAQVMPEEEIK